MSTTAIAISAGASAQAFAASALARHAECVSTINAMDGKILTVVEKQEYASCIQTVYPADMDAGTVIAIKVFIIIGILSALIGGIIGWKEYEDPIPVLIYGFVGMCAGPLLALLLFGIFYAIMFLFS